MQNLRIRSTFALLLGCVLAGSACATNPVTGKPQLALITESQEISMGREGAQQVEQSLGLVDDPALQGYVHRIGSELAAVSERPNLPWTFRVVEDPTPNAFALPGGFIFVTRGLLNLLTNESELAAVLGHEIGHVTARHSVSMISRAQLAQIGLVLGQIAVPQIGALGDAAGAGLQLLFLHYGRDAERQSDELGFRYSLERGYDVREMDDVFRALDRMGERQDRSAIPSWLASHPGGPERIRNAEERVAALPSPPDTSRLDSAEYLGHLERLVYGENPRNGFFRDGVFYHPELRFRMSFPPGWNSRNLSQAVTSASPQKDAVVQLTLSQGAGASESAQRFLSQQQVRPVQTTRENIQGNPAVVSLFQAQTQQGVVEGMAGWIEHGGRTYQILGYTPAGRFRGNESNIRRTIASFGPLTDPQLLGVQPDRVSIVRLTRGMTLADFQRQYPSAIAIEELAIINHVEGPSSYLPAGTLVKRVVKGTG